MLDMSRNRLAILAFAFGAFFFAAGMTATPAMAQHGDGGHQTEQVTHDDHGTPAHAEEAHGDAVHGEDAHAEGAHGEGEHSSMPHLPNLLTIISMYVPENVAHILEEWTNPIFAFIVIILTSIFVIGLSKNLDTRNPGRKQMAVEVVLGGLYGLFQQIIGPTARRYTPFLGSLFIFILLNNLFGMIPLGHASTSAFNTTTFALGMITFFIVQGIALKENGIGGYLHHMAGSPKTGMDWGFSLLLFPLHLLGELIKPISLALRLFGNIFGEDTLVATMVLLGAGITYGMIGSDFVPGIPLQFPFYFLGLLSSTIQALVFTLLATVYIALWLPHGEEHGH